MNKLDQALAIMSAYTKPHEIEWKIQTKDKKNPSALVVPFIDARAVIKRLNEAFGLHWSKCTEYIGHMGNDHMFRTTISVLLDDGIATISRDGYAPSTDIEPTKGGESDSFKRAGVSFGFGLDLYNYPKVTVELKEVGGYPKTFDLKPAFEAICIAVNDGTIDPDMEIIIGENGQVFRKEYGKPVPITTGKKAGPKKAAAPVEDTEPTVTLIKGALYGGNGIIPPKDFEKVKGNWLDNGGILYYGMYIYTVREGKRFYWQLDDAQLSKLTPKRKHG